MKYLFDTNTVSDLFSEDSAEFDSINARLSSLKDEDQIFVSVLTVYELEYGYANALDSAKQIVRNKIDRMLTNFGVLDLHPEGAGLFGEIKKKVVESRNLKKDQAKKHTVDIMLVVTALLESCTLVSSDKIYPDIQRLYSDFKYQNWLIIPSY